jgi:hypothetical protein
LTPSDAVAEPPTLARESNILGRLEDVLPKLGLVGENRNAKLIYLAVTSRFLDPPDRPVSIVVKGTSSVGKSFTIEVVLELFPEAAYFGRTTMSPKALLYTKEDFKHRMLVIYEAAGMANEDLQYLIRSLLSEGKISHDTVIPGKLQPLHIEKEGPTGLLISTTRINLHPENETRLVSITANDTAEQTKAITGRMAQPEAEAVDLEPWRALQDWLLRAEHRVVVPYALRLSELVPPVAVRLRRDFKTVLSLVKAHAILHQATRDRDETGASIATVEDYEIVRELVVDLISEGVGKSVKDEVRETVAAVETVALRSIQVNYKRLGEYLNLDTSAARRRAQSAISQGYVRNEAERNKEADLRAGDPLPENVAVLPPPEALSGNEEAESDG